MINERYLIKKKLGQGRSAVYLCEDSEYPDKEIAIKILSADASVGEEKAFNDEYFILRRLNHPGIIKANDLGTVVKKGKDDVDLEIGSKFITMEFFPGCELIDYDKFNDDKILFEIIRQICSVLYYLHQSNYIYYDLKQENILVSNIKGKLFIKLIDLGFAKHIQNELNQDIRGTAEYIAPELLRKEKHDHRVDLYSLGILLYRIVYNSFPFETKNEMEIYKSHLEAEFSFPPSELPKVLMVVIKRLLVKEPGKRYDNILQVLSDLDIKIDEQLTNEWLPASVFSNRTDVLTILNTYLHDESSGEIFVVKGAEGSGKTSLISEIYSNYSNVVSIYEDKSKSGIEFINLILKRIIYSENVYSLLTDELKDRIEKLLSDSPSDFIDQLKSVINKLAASAKFILLLDGFGFYDDFTVEVLKNIFPILQVHGIKIILSENSESDIKSKIINNQREINLSAFTDSQLDEFLEKSFYKQFPREELKKLILLYADLLPGNITSFIKDLILLNVIQFNAEGVNLISDDRTSGLLKSSHEEIYKIRLNSLNTEELETAKFLSAFDSSLDTKTISILHDKSFEQLTEIYEGLQDKNIIQQINLTANPVFVTEGLKKFVYFYIDNKKEYHSKIVKKIQSKIPSFNKSELSKQFELSGDYKESYLVVQSEIKLAEKISAYSYQKRLLVHLLKLPLEHQYKIEIKFDLVKIYIKMSEFNLALDLIEELSKSIPGKNKLFDLAMSKASCLIGMGEYVSGRNLLNELIPQSEDKNTKLKLLVEIAHAEFELDRFDEAAGLCNQIIQNENSSGADKGKCYNFLGLIELYKENNFSGALSNFEKAEKIYQEAGLKLRVAQMEMNMGNIYNNTGNQKLAESYWNKSLQLNQSIGNLEQEALLLMNFGVSNFHKLNYEKSIEFYQRAHSIFLSLGNKSGRAIVQTNMGELHFITCEYQKAITFLTEAKNIYESLQSYNECLEAFFLLCRTYFAIGDYKTYGRMLKEFEELTSIDSVNEKHKMNLVLLKALLLQDENELKENLTRLIEIKNNYLQNEEKYNYFYTSSLIVKILIKLNEFTKALSELNSEELLAICKEYSYFEAERIYLLGLLSDSGNEPELKPALDYFLKSYELLKDLHISELTWRVMYMITFSYAERGNVSRASDYLVYTKSVIDYIAENIYDQRLKLIYYDQHERHSSLETLNRIAEKI